MRLKESIQFLLWKGIKDVVLIAAVAIVSGVVLALILKPSGVEAQTYEPQTTEVQTPEVQDTANNDNKNNPYDQCKDYKGIVSEALCRQAAVADAVSQDRTQNVVKSKTDETGGLMGTIYPLVAGVDNPEGGEEAASPYWRSVYASLPAGAKYGLAGLATEGAYMAMIYNPVRVDTTATYYAYNFLPSPIKTEVINTDVYAATHWTLGNPPDGTNSFKYLNTYIGQLWMAMFKLSTGIFVIVLTAAGIMIIMRQKVGQNVVSVYMAIKNIVIGYIGAFFSLGIGSLFFTFSKWLMIVFAVLLRSITINGSGVDSVFLDGLISGSLSYSLYTARIVWKGVKTTVLKNMAHEYYPPKKHGLAAVVQGAFAAFKGAFSAVVGGILGLFVIVAVGAAIFFIFFKLFIKVLKIYVSMAIDIVLAPLFFLLGSIPGNEATITDWFKRMFKNSLKVPLMFFIVNIGFALMLAGDQTLKAITGGAITGGTGLFESMGLYTIVPLIVISSANGIDNVIEQMMGGPSKTAGALAQGAQSVLKGVPLIGGAVS